MVRYGTALLALMVTAASSVQAQQVAFKGAITRSMFEVDGTTPFDQPLTATSLGGHVRIGFGPFALQPELHITTRGGTVDEGNPTASSMEKEQLRLEYLDIPVLLVFPVQFGDFEAFAAAGPMLAIESRCRYVYTIGDLKTNVGCDPPREPLFRRNVIDYGVTAGAGLSRRVGSGRVLLEARHTWGMRDIVQDRDEFALRNRTFALMLGYVVAYAGDDLN